MVVIVSRGTHFRSTIADNNAVVVVHCTIESDSDLLQRLVIEARTLAATDSAQIDSPVDDNVRSNRINSPTESIFISVVPEDSICSKICVSEILRSLDDDELNDLSCESESNLATADYQLLRAQVCI